MDINLFITAQVGIGIIIGMWMFFLVLDNRCKVKHVCIMIIFPLSLGIVLILGTITLTICNLYKIYKSSKSIVSLKEFLNRNIIEIIKKK